MAEYLIKDTSLTAIADAIREKTGSQDPLAFPDEFIEAIEGIEGMKIAYGSFTPASTVSSYTLTHGLGKIPDFIMLIRINTSTSALNLSQIIIAAIANAADDFQAFTVQYSQSKGVYSYCKDSCDISGDVRTDSFYQGRAFHAANANTVHIQGSTYGKLDTAEYYWIAF